MVRRLHKINILIIIAGVILISSIPAFFSSSGQARNPGQLYIDLPRAPLKNIAVNLVSAGITGNESQINLYAQESQDFNGLAGVIYGSGSSEEYRINVYLCPSYLLLRNLILSDLDLPPPLFGRS